LLAHNVLRNLHKLKKYFYVLNVMMNVNLLKIMWFKLKIMILYIVIVVIKKKYNWIKLN